MTSPDTQGRRGLLLYLFVTFLVSWGAWITAIQLGGSANTSPTVVLYALGGFGPMIGAAVVRFRRRRRPAPAHAVRSRGWRLAWILPALIMGAGSITLGTLLSPALGGPTVTLASVTHQLAVNGGILAFIALTLITGPIPEETGWRGTAYPRLRARMPRPAAMLVLATIWATWHLPLFFIHDTTQNTWGLASWDGIFFLLAVYPITALTCFAYERAGFAASAAVHFGVNGALTLLAISAPQALGMSAAVLAVVAAFVLLATSRPKPTLVEPAGSYDSEPTVQLVR
jgi:membrane protease YdiL (CAAX protease family)